MAPLKKTRQKSSRVKASPKAMVETLENKDLPEISMSGLDISKLNPQFDMPLVDDEVVKEASSIIDELLKQQDKKTIEELLEQVRTTSAYLQMPPIEEVKTKVQPLRVALLSWETLHSISVGGVAAHVTELACALERKGHEAHVFTRMAFAGQAQYELIDGVHYHRVPYVLHRDFIEDVNNMCRSFVSTVFQVEDFMGRHFDVVHAHDWLASNAMVWVKQGRGRKGVITIHSTEYGRCGNNFYAGPSQKIRDHERHGTFCADRVIAVSHATKGEVMWMYNTPDHKVSVVYNGVSPKFYDGDVDVGGVKKRFNIGPMDPMVLFAGRMTQQKGPDILIESVPHILRFHPHAKFVFAGDGNLRGPVEQRAHKLGVAHACRFLGHQNAWGLRDLYKACDCVCVPSRNEPFGIVILEAWSSGKPVIATNIGGPSEIVWHDVTGYKIHPNPDSIAWGIGSLFAGFEHGRWMGSNGRKAAEKDFSWDVIADHTIGVYKGII